MAFDAQIDKTLLEQILHTAQHPTISLRSTRVARSEASFTLDGDLTIIGVTRPVTVQGRVAGSRALGTASVVQTRWGIRPYSAFPGALKLRDEVTVEFEVALTSQG